MTIPKLGSSVAVPGLVRAGGQRQVQRFHEAMDVTEGVVERNRSDPQDLRLPHVALAHTTHVNPGVGPLEAN